MSSRVLLLRHSVRIPQHFQKQNGNYMFLLSYALKVLRHHFYKTDIQFDKVLNHHNYVKVDPQMQILQKAGLKLELNT